MKTVSLHRLVSAIIIGCVWVTTALPFFAHDAIQPGREFPVHIAKLYGWEHAKSCGLCFFWENNSGGSPFFGDPYTPAQHPFVALSTLLTNPIVAANLTMLFALTLLAGAGLIYAHLQRFSFYATVWLTCMLMVGGHFMARIEVGSIALPLSLAATVLALVVCLGWIANPTWQWGLYATLAIANLGLSGQGYFQLVFLLCCIPLGGIAWRQVRPHVIRQALVYIPAAVGLLLLPMLTSYVLYGTLMHKEGDTAAAALPDLLTYLSLFVESDYREGAERGREAQWYPYLYSNYTGYVTFLFMGVALLRAGISARTKLPTTLTQSWAHTSMRMWGSVVVIAALLVSGIPQAGFLWLDVAGVSTVVGYLRNVVVVGSLIAVAVMCLSAHGVEWILARVHALAPTSPWQARAGSTALVALLGWQILVAQQYGGQYSQLVPYEPDRSGFLAALADQPTSYLSVATDTQYFDVLQSHHKNFWNLYYPYYPDNTPAIPAAYSLTADDLGADPAWQPVNVFESWTLFRDTRSTAQYISFVAAQTDATTVCTYTTEAGTIDVRCDLPNPQRLVVHEYAFPDWMVHIDDAPAELAAGDFLTVLVPAGVHTISFRYRPWLVIGATGIAVFAWCIAIGMLMWVGMRQWLARTTKQARDA